MTKEEIIKYVLNSPENTNPNVLEGMLDELTSGGSSMEPFFIRYDSSSEHYDKTFKEAKEAFLAGRPVMVIDDNFGIIDCNIAYSLYEDPNGNNYELQFYQKQLYAGEEDQYLAASDK